MQNEKVDCGEEYQSELSLLLPGTPIVRAFVGCGGGGGTGLWPNWHQRHWTCWRKWSKFTLAVVDVARGWHAVYPAIQLRFSWSFPSHVLIHLGSIKTDWEVLQIRGTCPRCKGVIKFKGKIGVLSPPMCDRHWHCWVWVRWLSVWRPACTETGVRGRVSVQCSPAGPGWHARLGTTQANFCFMGQTITLHRPDWPGQGSLVTRRHGGEP